MARDGVSYEQVKAAAEALMAEGREPSIRVVRERLRGTGSPNTIHKHLTKWREARPEAPSTTIDLPQAIIREINGEIQRAASAARAEVETQLAQTKTEAADLAAAGEALEAERDALTEHVATLTSERDVQAGKTAEQAAEIGRLGQELERERRAAEEARIEVAQTRLANEAQKAQLAEQRREIEQLRVEVRQERQARTDAERDLAAATAAREGLAERLSELQSREQLAVREISELRGRLEQSQEAARTAAVDATRLAGEVGALRDTVERVSVENSRLSDLLQPLGKDTSNPPQPPAASGGSRSSSKKAGS